MPDYTTDPARASFIEVVPDDPFPLQNLPYGVFTTGPGDDPRIGVAIGAYVLDLYVLQEQHLFAHPAIARHRPFARASLNRFMSLGRDVWHAVRHTISHLLDAGTPTLRDDPDLRALALIPQRDVTMRLPAEIQNYTDFYASREHATTVGTLFRGAANALHPNWLHLPVGYHGRASSVIVSGRDVRRPCGQFKPDDGPPTFGPSRLLDFELEMGFFVGPGNALGEPIPVDRAADHLFGFVLVNDWSARDIQHWEYVPLGPFLGKNFATTISPWVVTTEALDPFRCAGPVQDPEPLPYLRTSGDAAYDIHLSVGLQTPALAAPYPVCDSNYRYLYWNARQLLAHHTSGGCNARPGDLMASGTISGPTAESAGSLLERTRRGTHPLALPDGTTRTFLQDGDRVVMTAWAQGDGYRIGFGEASATILPAICP